MDAFEVKGGIPLHGEITLSGAKNVALKAFVASLLTDDEVTIRNVPDIRDVRLMLDVLGHLGVDSEFTGNTARLKYRNGTETTVPLEIGAKLRTSFLVLGPLLARKGEALIPNPGGCRIGARPIDRQVDAYKAMGAKISYSSGDGFFHAETNHLHAADIVFPKNTHTGTEAVILSAVMADGTSVIKNAAEEVEVDDLIALLNAMGAKIRRSAPREITIDGVTSLHGVEYTIMADRNEEVTYAVAAAVTGGMITVHGSQHRHLDAFLKEFTHVGGTADVISETSIRYGGKPPFKPSDIVTKPHPGFMTDWQAPWALLMTQADGTSTIHETIFESRFSYVDELRKMGARIGFYDPPVDDPQSFYNFNWSDKVEGYHQAIRIQGPDNLHNAVLAMHDLRAGATLLLASLAATGESYISGVDQIDRGYELIDDRLRNLGARISRVKEGSL
jgi:UDP-N-acetylglucosamine 1-carboxyvinyltransferase